MKTKTKPKSMAPGNSFTSNSMAGQFHAFDSSMLAALDKAFGIVLEGEDDEYDDEAVNYEEESRRTAAKNWFMVSQFRLDFTSNFKKQFEIINTDEDGVDRNRRSAGLY